MIARGPLEHRAFPDAVISSVSLVKQNVYVSHTPFVVSITCSRLYLFHVTYFLCFSLTAS